MKKVISVFLFVLTFLMLAVIPCSAQANTAPITMNINGFKSREVLSFNYEFSRPTDIDGELAGIPRAKTFVIRAAGLKDGNNDLFAWAVAGGIAPKNLALNFVNTIDGSDIKVIKLNNAYCTGYTEYWNQDGTYYEEIEVVYKSLENGRAVYENPWN